MHLSLGDVLDERERYDSPRVFQDDQNDLRVLELGTLGHIVVTVSLSLRTVSSTDSRSYHTAAVSEEGPKVKSVLEASVVLETGINSFRKSK